jgi:4-aminobutyrate aminotransferase-like enzyme/Ser/Thr protein kinase RdoA (MazF antagonist)
MDREGPDVSEDWSGKLGVQYGLCGPLARLDGEYDLNFCGQDSAGDLVIKVMRQGCDPALVDLQIKALAALRDGDPDLPVPDLVPAQDGSLLSRFREASGAERLIWAQRALPGIAYAKAGPQSPDLLAELGRLTGRFDRALAEFEHPALDRATKWRLTEGDWIVTHLDCLQDPHRRDLIGNILADFNALRPDLQRLPAQAIHNDLNDYNILLVPDLAGGATVRGLIDLGDMIASPRVCEVAIAGAYVVLDHEQPQAALAAFVAGYHATNPLLPAEVDLIWPLLRMRLAVSVVNSTLEAAARPDDPYVTVSQGPAWRFLERAGDDAALVMARLRTACGLAVIDSAPAVLAWLDRNRGGFAPVLDEDLTGAPMGALSVAATAIPRNPFDLGANEAAGLARGADDAGQTWLGYYAEPRLIYTAPAFRKGPWRASDRRSVHLGVDVFAPAGRAVRAPLVGRVEIVENRAQNLDYGGVVILRHLTESGDVFYTLYGHLDPVVCDRLSVGQMVAQGEPFCHLGTPAQNGGWAPHLHFQLALSVAGMGGDWPGVADPDDLGLWTALCPNPAALLNLSDARLRYQPIDEAGILANRRAHFADNLMLSYRRPLMLLRGWRHHLFDEMGRAYLDAYNNVPHVGHAHPRIAAVAADQLTRMNSNTRYLHPAQIAFAEKITSKMPAGLEVVFMVNSGSEANELALRLARAWSGAKDMITPDHGYHGNTTGAIGISAYKFMKPGGGGQPDWVQLVDVADDYRGRFRRDDPDRAEKYAALIDDAIAKIVARRARLAGFIAETYPSVGGQIIPPPGYLAKVYARIRAAGGLCIADEVQTGLGRLGEHYFAFDEQGARPDIVVLGKPIGNGHPMGVVVTSREIADRFAEGPEFFSTFGGSTLSCRIGKEVLDIVDDEGLQSNAHRQGLRLLDGLRALQDRHPLIGDVRGAGLFIGVELVTDRTTLAPATDAARFVMNRLRDLRILIGREGPADNILKIRPPLTIEADDIDMILDRLDLCLGQAETAQGFGAP